MRDEAYLERARGKVVPIATVMAAATTPVVASISRLLRLFSLIVIVSSLVALSICPVQIG